MIWSNSCWHNYERASYVCAYTQVTDQHEQLTYLTALYLLLVLTTLHLAGLAQFQWTGWPQYQVSSSTTCSWHYNLQGFDQLPCGSMCSPAQLLVFAHPFCNGRQIAREITTTPNKNSLQLPQHSHIACTVERTRWIWSYVLPRMKTQCIIHAGLLACITSDHCTHYRTCINLIGAVGGSRVNIRGQIKVNNGP